MELQKAHFFKEKHVQFMRRCLQVIPTGYSSFDTTRLTIAFFAIGGLDLLQSLHTIQDDRQHIIDWIYSLQVLPSADGEDSTGCGFRGSSTISGSRVHGKVPYDWGHLAMTYSGLASLVILGDDLSRVSRRAIVGALKSLQLPDGSFSAVVEGSESDMRFVYCAVAVSYILCDWSGVDVPRVLRYITDSMSYDGGIGQGSGSESHGGLCYCAVATLCLLDRMDLLGPKETKRLERWCAFRQHSGFQGRPNKPQDTCYSFWVGATLQMLGVFEHCDFERNREFVLSTQSLTTGGLAKYPDNTPDLLHTYIGIGGLSLMGEEGLLEIHPALNMSRRAAQHLSDLHEKWQCVS